MGASFSAAELNQSLRQDPLAFTLVHVKVHLYCDPVLRSLPTLLGDYVGGSALE